MLRSCFTAKQALQGGMRGRLAGVITVEVIEARLPRRISVTKKEKPLNPYAAIVVGHSHVAIRCAPPPADRAVARSFQA